MKYELKLSGRKEQELSATIFVEVPDGTTPEAVSRVCTSVFDDFMFDDDLWEVDENEPVMVDGILSVRTLDDDEHDNVDLKLVLGDDGLLVPANAKNSSKP
jgi:hypothetical protein